MATYQKFNPFLLALANKKINLATDTIKFMLTNTAPVATNGVKADITEISGGGYPSGGYAVTVSSVAQTSGQVKVVADDQTITASGGAVGAFRYLVAYSDTATNKDLINFLDYGSSITLATGESLDVDFNGSSGWFTIGA